MENRQRILPRFTFENNRSQSLVPIKCDSQFFLQIRKDCIVPLGGQSSRTTLWSREFMVRNQTKLIGIGTILMVLLTGIIVNAVFEDVEGPLISDRPPGGIGLPGGRFHVSAKGEKPW